MCFFIVNQKTAYEMRISDWSSDVCSSDLRGTTHPWGESRARRKSRGARVGPSLGPNPTAHLVGVGQRGSTSAQCTTDGSAPLRRWPAPRPSLPSVSCQLRSEEHTSELQSLMRISYAVFCLKKKKKHIHNP